ncbi:MAG: hypothetical protein PWP24_1280, partial [Clostridiales bacterium]|nr:hypothetical protein [Clostridiales bacterium]
VLFGASDTVLVDCGYPGSLHLLEKELRDHNIDPSDLTKLVLTHQDDDHMGAAYELKERYPAIQILASHIEEPYISGKVKNLRLQQAEEMQASLPANQKSWGEQFIDRLRSLNPIKVNLALHAGDRFDWAGGCEIVETPGHTPGHISIRSLHHDFIITGDAAVLEGDHFVVANPQYSLDLETAKKSLVTILSYPCNLYICYHGGIYTP